MNEKSESELKLNQALESIRRALPAGSKCTIEIEMVADAAGATDDDSDIIKSEPVRVRAHALLGALEEPERAYLIRRFESSVLDQCNPSNQEVREISRYIKKSPSSVRRYVKRIQEALMDAESCKLEWLLEDVEGVAPLQLEIQDKMEMVQKALAMSPARV